MGGRRGSYDDGERGKYDQMEVACGTPEDSHDDDTHLYNLGRTASWSTLLQV